jgi:hypothetical protein
VRLDEHFENRVCWCCGSLADWLGSISALLGAGMDGKARSLPHVEDAQPREGKMLKKFKVYLPFLVIRDLLGGHSAPIRIDS